VSQKRTKHDDPRLFLDAIVEQSDQRLGSGSAEILGFFAGGALALLAPLPARPLVRTLVGSTLGSLLGKKLGGKDAAWFKRRLELALDRFDEAQRLHSEGKLSAGARADYVDDLIQRFYDKSDSLLE
jgi:hypothetical protein